MPAQKSGLVSTVFTTLVAPILVSLAVRDLTREDAQNPQAGQKHSQQNATQRPHSSVGRAAAPPPVAEKPATVQAVGHGTGRTPDEALQDALRNAVHSVAAAHFEPGLTSQQQAALVEVVLRDLQRPILHWQDRGGSSSWKWGGRVYQREVAVTLDARALAGSFNATLRAR